MSDDEEYPKPAPFGSISMSTRFDDDDDDDDDDGPSRRIGAHAPSFAPVTTMQHNLAPAPLASSSISTLQQKASAVGAPALSRAGAPSSSAPLGQKFLWHLDAVPTLPEFHQVERAAVFVPHAHPSEVTERISDVLRERSIEASYDDDKAKVKCVTADGVDFRVRLYRGRGSYSHGIIVEVQRRFGTSATFHKDSQAILDAAEGKMPPPPPPSFRGASIPMVSDTEDDYAPSGASSLDMIAKMLSFSGYDSHYLAYQTLIPLTDSAKMGRGTAKAVSKELLSDGNEVGGKVRSLVMAKKNEEDMFKLRSMALTVLANAVAAVKGDISLSLREELRPMLLDELENADKNPRTAQLAAQCIEHLIKGDHEVDEIHCALEKAEEAGAARHAGLKRQAERCLQVIRGTR